MSSEERAAAAEVGGSLEGGSGSGTTSKVVEEVTGVEGGDVGRKEGAADGLAPRIPTPGGAASASIEDLPHKRRPSERGEQARTDASDHTSTSTGGNQDIPSGDEKVDSGVDRTSVAGGLLKDDASMAEKQAAASTDTRVLAHALESTHLHRGAEEEVKVQDPAVKRPRIGSVESDSGNHSKEEGGGAADAMVDSDAALEEQKNVGSDDEWTRGGMESDDDAMSVQSFDFSSSDSEADGNDEDVSPKPALLSRRFDADLVVASIEGGEPVLKQVEGRDVVLIVGKTGTGKSTLIQALAGRTLRKTEYRSSVKRGNDTDTASKFVYEAVDPLPGFEIGHGKTSQTSSIGCFDPEQIRRDVGTEGSASKLVYVDSPGFEDTNGQEADIATSVMLSEVAKRCRSLRFVILISFVSLLEDRGGAVRSVLRLIRGFTKDFKAERQSFLFLFTHSNEVVSIPDSIEAAKKHLRDEIIQNIEGAGKNDEDAEVVLEHIRRALKKGHPFVDVFLPLKTDTAALAGTIEKYVKPTKEPHLASICGLTQSSRLTLSGELQNQLQLLRRHLGEATLNEDKVNSSLKMFRYFDRYVGTEDVRGIVLDVRSLIGGHIKEAMAYIQNEVIKGTRSDHDFGPADVTTVKNSFSRLCILREECPEQVDLEGIKCHVKEELVRFRDQLMIGRGQCFDGLQHDLAKMLAWSKGFPEFLPLYKGITSHLASVIEASIADIVSTKSDEIAGLSVAELESYFENLSVLQSVSENAEDLALHALDVNGASDVYIATIESIRSTAILWETSMQSELQAATRHEQKLRSIVAVSNSVEAMVKLLDRFPLCSRLADQVGRLREQLATEGADLFEAKASEIDIASIECSPQEVQAFLRQIRLASNLFSSIGEGCWRLLSAVHDDLVERVKSFLRTRMGEVDEMSSTAKQQGIKNGRREGQMLSGFKSLVWFDDFLRFEERFVENSSIKFFRAYKDRIAQVESEVDYLLKTIAEDPGNSGPVAKTLQNLLVELGQISILGETVQSDTFPPAEEHAREKLCSHVKALVDRALNDVNSWKEVLLNGLNRVQTLEVVSQRIEIELRESSVLSHLDAECDDMINTLRSAVDEATAKYSNVTMSTMKSTGKYREKSKHLHVVSSLGKYTFLARRLPGVGELKTVARDAVAADAKEIEDLVSETSDWDEIDGLLMKFQDATILDEFTSYEATSRLRPLMQLREQKQDEVDNLLESLIQANDFGGIREFILPYAESRDQVKKQKFMKWKTMISASLTSTVGSLALDLEGDPHGDACQRVAGQLKMLEQAKRELKNHLSNLPGGLKLGKEIADAKKSINTKLRSLLQGFEEDKNDFNYEGLGIKYRFITTMMAHLASFLSHANLTKARSSEREYKKSLEVVSKALLEFVESRFQKSSKFVRILSSLKNANDCISPTMDDLVNLYEKTTASLANKLNEAVADISESVEKNGCYDDAIDIMSTLNQHLNRGLKDHVDATDLSFNSDSQLSEWREEKQKIDREMEFDGSNADVKLKEWKKQLDKLDPDSNSWRISKAFSEWKSGTTYQGRVGQAKQKVADRFLQGKKALTDSNHLLLKECVEILDLIATHISKHVPDARKRSQELRQCAIDSFKELCKKAQTVLQNPQKIKFQGDMFSDYRGYVLHVKCVMASNECKKALSLTNQLLHDALVGDINDVRNLLDSFTFNKVKAKLQQARKFGGFLADRCTLLSEEIKLYQDVDFEDRWLNKIFDLCQMHFSQGRSLGSVKSFAILGLPTNASEKDVKAAYRKLAKKYHPDKTQTDETSPMFRRVAEAKDTILQAISSRQDAERPFASLINDIFPSLRQETKTCLEEQRYDRVEQLVFKLSDIKPLVNLVSPPLDHGHIVHEVYEMVRSHVQQARLNVNSHWSSRDYRALNDTITDLKLMEESFKSYDEIFSSSWDDGIVKEVELEIEALGRRARGYVASNRSAKENLDDFRRCFLQMGHVLVELPLFKDFTKTVMCGVLEASLSSDWGYSFLFDFGLGLQRGDENSSEEDNHVAQILVAEFSHFKEVMTMVWNEETSQKPADDTVQGIKGHRRKAGQKEELALQKDQLLDSFREFDAQYKKLLGEYIDPDADLQSLVNKTVALAAKLCPLDCDAGWDEKVKQKIPKILAGVFTVFTVLKSGQSYNRLDSTSGNEDMGQKLLMKPHNIQILTLLSLFGCGYSSSGLDSQLMQIRTGEGKSMILGAAAVVVALLGFKARCVCYSEYLSARDFNLFQDVFDLFSVTDFIKYSKITTLSEDTTAEKGNIRYLTETLLQGSLRDTAVSVRRSSPRGGATVSPVNVSDGGRPSAFAAANEIEDAAEATVSTRRKSSRRKKRIKNQVVSSTSTAGAGTSIAPRAPKGRPLRSGTSPHETVRKEILLVDEVDVFFGSDFYGQTYNQVSQIREPEISDILNHIWIANKRSSRRQRLADVQALPAYLRLVAKMPSFKFLVDAEISLMIDQVRKVDEEPYYLDRETDRIGYKVMDSISFEATYGYRTVFAYLQEAEKGNLKHRDSTLDQALVMPVSCGQFSYAEIFPERILGVSGTLSALGDYECDVLSKYGVETFLYVPSVYGESNFQFDKAGDGIRIETSKSDYFHSITDQIQVFTKQKRSVIVFFQDTPRLKEFTNSSFYRKLSRRKKLLTEDLSPSDKEFVISKAATSGQITISTAVFGRGTDFFCKDESVQRNGGVHVIQAFLSDELSEEIQIQGRTARQGKKGSYQMILLDSDLEGQFGLPVGTKDNVPKERWYQHLSSARDKRRQDRCRTIEDNLVDATQKDKETHRYFDALLSKDAVEAGKLFKEIYTSFKKGSMPSSIELDFAFLLDVTGSMAPFARAVASTVNNMIIGRSSITAKLKSKYPEIEFHLRVGVMAYRDIDDNSQFTESPWRNANTGRFTTAMADATSFVASATSTSSGGADLAEDHIGAIHRCANWNSPEDWTSPIKFMLLFTDSPAHGMVPSGSAHIANVDNYTVRHPSGLTAEAAVDSLISNDIDLLLCSFNPAATKTTEEELSKHYLAHRNNSEQREITSIPMMPLDRSQSIEVLGGHGKHIVFVLDQSGSMNYSWSGVVAAYNQYISRRRQNQSESDLVSVVQFDDVATVSVRMSPIGQAPNNLSYSGGGTCFHPAAQSACELASATPSSHIPVVVFMSDGCAHDAAQAAGAFSHLNRGIRHSHESDLELHVIAFGNGASTQQLQQIAGSSRNGKLHTSADTAQLSNIFVEIAGGSGVADVLEAEIGKRISDAVSDRLSLEYIG